MLSVLVRLLGAGKMRLRLAESELIVDRLGISLLGWRIVIHLLAARVVVLFAMTIHSWGHAHDFRRLHVLFCVVNGLEVIATIVHVILDCLVTRLGCVPALKLLKGFTKLRVLLLLAVAWLDFVWLAKLVASHILLLGSHHNFVIVALIWKLLNDLSLISAGELAIPIV